MSKNKRPDRIYTTKNVKELTSKIDQEHYFHLDSGHINRTNLFLFAMSLGVETMPMRLENINSGGFILENSIDSKTRAAMYAIFINKIGEENLDEITDKYKVYELAQE